MNYIDFSLISVVAVVCGTAAQLTSGYSKGGWVVNLLIGFFGALGGVFLSRWLHAPLLWDLQIGPVSFPIVYCCIGAAILLAAASLAIKPGRN